MKKAYWIMGAVLAAVLAAGSWWWLQRDAADAALYRTGKLERAGLQATMAASAAVYPVSQVVVVSLYRQSFK